MVEICFENREADVGRFLRRQLAGKDVAALVTAFQQIETGRLGITQGLITTFTENQSTVPISSLRERALNLLHSGNERFAKALTGRTSTPEQKQVADSGTWSVALVIDPPRSGALPDQVFRATLAASNPQYTGWPVWLDSTGFNDTTARPVVTEKGLEALIVALGGWFKHIDFMRLDPIGEFYLWRNLADDASDKIKAGTALDPIIVIIRVAEAIAVGLAFAKALGWESQSARLGFAFRWTKLKGRRLEPWANPLVTISAFEAAHDDEVTTFVELSLDTPASAIAPFVDEATRDLFVLFGGYRIPFEAIERWVQRLIERKL